MAAVSNPTDSAIWSIESAVRSKRLWAASTRWCVSQRWGVVPVCSRNCRTKVRSDMPAFRARSCRLNARRRFDFFVLSALHASAADSHFDSEFARRWNATRKLAVGVADAMPPDEYAFKPDPPTMTFGEQMAHLAWANYAFCAALKDAKAPALPDATAKDVLVRRVADSFDYCTRQLEAVTPAEMDSIHSTPDGRLNGRELLLALYVHMAHHRGQAEVYLRLKGIQPPSYVF